MSEPNKGLDIYKALLDTVASNPADEEIRQLAEDLLSRSRPRLKIAVLALIGNRIKGARYLLEKSDQVAQALLSPARIEHASTQDLLAIFKTLREMQDSDIDRFTETAGLEPDKKVRRKTRKQERLAHLVRQTRLGNVPSD